MWHIFFNGYTTVLLKDFFSRSPWKNSQVRCFHRSLCKTELLKLVFFISYVLFWRFVTVCGRGLQQNHSYGKKKKNIQYIWLFLRKMLAFFTTETILPEIRKIQLFRHIKGYLKGIFKRHKGIFRHTNRRWLGAYNCMLIYINILEPLYALAFNHYDYIVVKSKGFWKIFFFIYINGENVIFYLSLKRWLLNETTVYLGHKTLNR